jgi:hypothetical protein
VLDETRSLTSGVPDPTENPCGDACQSKHCADGAATMMTTVLDWSDSLLWALPVRLLSQPGNAQSSNDFVDGVSATRKTALDKPDNLRLQCLTHQGW